MKPHNRQCATLVHFYHCRNVTSKKTVWLKVISEEQANSEFQIPLEHSWILGVVKQVLHSFFARWSGKTSTVNEQNDKTVFCYCSGAVAWFCLYSNLLLEWLRKHTGYKLAPVAIWASVGKKKEKWLKFSDDRCKFVAACFRLFLVFPFRRQWDVLTCFNWVFSYYSCCIQQLPMNGTRRYT